MILQRWLATCRPRRDRRVARRDALVYAPIARVQSPSECRRRRRSWSVVGLAVICTAIAFLVFFALIAEVGPVRATVITYINPAVAAVLGVTILERAFTVGMGIGFALVLAGSVLATRRAVPPEAPAAALDPACETA